MNPTLEASIKAKAVDLGFDLVGITSAEPSVFAAEYRDWIGNGYAGEMEYLARNLERRIDPRRLLPDARSIIVVGMNYYTRSEERGARNEGDNPHPRPLSRKRREGWMVTDAEPHGRENGETGRDEESGRAGEGADTNPHPRPLSRKRREGWMVTDAEPHGRENGETGRDEESGRAGEGADTNPHPRPLSRKRREGWMVTDAEPHGRENGETGRDEESGRAGEGADTNPHPRPLSRKRREGWMVTDAEPHGRENGETGRDEESGRAGEGADTNPHPRPLSRKRREGWMKAHAEVEAETSGPGEKDALLPTSYPLLPRREAAVFARYARGDDYHDVMGARLRTLLEYLKSEAGPDSEGRVYVDTGPILEREVARRAGLGWFGKNTMLINTRRGSYFFLGEIVTNVALTPDEPAVGGCGTCTRCLDACPTNAFVAPFVLDSRRCISYLTIELKGAIPEEFIPAIAAAGNRVYGCDICQEVCPFNTDRGTGGGGDGETLGVGEWESGRVGDFWTGRREDGETGRLDGWATKRGYGEEVPLPWWERLEPAPREPRGEGENESTDELLSINRSIPTPGILPAPRNEDAAGRDTEHRTPVVHGSSPASDPAFQPRAFLRDINDVKDLLYLTQEEFSAAFKGSAAKRAKRRGLLRNAAAALASRDDTEAIAALEHALNDPEELVRDAAGRALGHINARRRNANSLPRGGKPARKQLDSSP